VRTEAVNGFRTDWNLPGTVEPERSSKFQSKFQAAWNRDYLFRFKDSRRQDMGGSMFPEGKLNRKAQLRQTSRRKASRRTPSLYYAH
jgi:hypothetical protein